MLQEYCISRDEAVEMIKVVEEAIIKEKQRGAIAIVDAHGELVAFLKMDGSIVSATNNAINKAYTAAREGRPSGMVGLAAKEYGFPMTNYCDKHYTGWHGGFPVVFEGQTIGAIGISGIDQELEISLGQMAAERI